MVREFSVLVLSLYCILLYTVRFTEAACKQLGQSCDVRNHINCCDQYKCVGFTCQLRSNLNSHDRSCQDRLGSKCAYPGSFPGYCDCCPKFSPDYFCFSNYNKVQAKIAELGPSYLDNKQNPDVYIYDHICKDDYLRQQRACDDCGDLCQRIR
ncbi:hypothetical protein BY458DRAFT_528640 [Sporodiniella umbellata]|nr:hypothetical protein BY458DRAFT_528640 [Sporodiniella umbellata]